MQAGGETLQEFAAAVEQLAHQALVGLPADHIQTEAAHAFIDVIRDREVKQYLLLGGARTLNEALNQAVKLEAAKAAAWPAARLREATRVPTERPPTPSECRRSERPVCWWCGQPGHIQKYCRQRPPEEMGQDPRTRRGVSESPIKPPRYAVKVLAEWAKGSLIADGWVQEKPCRVSIDTGASATVARPDIVAGLTERELSQPYVLQTASGETMPVKKEAHVELTMGQSTLRSWVFVADIADDFILELDILRAHDASVDIGRRVLRLGQDEVPVREAPTPSESKRARTTENRRNLRPVCWQCGKTGHLWRGCPRGPAKEAVDRSNWRRGCATGRRSEARRQVAESARTPPCLTHQSDEKGRLETYVVALEGQIEGQKARLAELEAVLERKTEATTEARRHASVV
jgi:hypothetical protein